jgi:hypothetical protein
MRPFPSVRELNSRKIQQKKGKFSLQKKVNEVESKRLDNVSALPHMNMPKQKQFKALFDTNLKDPIHRSLQSYLYRHQFHPEVEGRAVKIKEFIVKSFMSWVFFS